MGGGRRRTPTKTMTTPCGYVRVMPISATVPVSAVGIVVSGGPAVPARGLGLCDIRQELERRGGNREGPGRCSIRQEGCGIRQDELGSRRTRESPGRCGGIRQEPGLRDTHQWGRHTRETD